MPLELSIYSLSNFYVDIEPSWLDNFEETLGWGAL